MGWIIYIKTDAFLLEGRSKALCHSMHQLRNIVQTEMNLHALLLHFVEIEQLIDEQEQTLGVTVDNRKRLRDSLTIGKFSGNLFPMLFRLSKGPMISVTGVRISWAIIVKNCRRASLIS